MNVSPTSKPHFPAMSGRVIIIIAVVSIFAVAIASYVSTPRAFTKTTWEYDEDGPAAAIHLPIEPHGLALFVAPDDTTDSHTLIDEIVAVWPQLWPKMRGYLNTEMKGYGVEAVLGRDEFIGSLDRMTPDVYMGDKSDIMIRLEFKNPPLWDFFIRGTIIAHSQPVF